MSKSMATFILRTYYTQGIGAFGCRSTKTLRILRQYQIKCYFSACLTMTTNMQGSPWAIPSSFLLSSGHNWTGPEPEKLQQYIGLNALDIEHNGGHNDYHHHHHHHHHHHPVEQGPPPSKGTKIIPPKKDSIIMVDVVDGGVVPSSVVRRAKVLRADIPAQYPKDPIPLQERFAYAYRLLSQYAAYAKVVITSRIHVVLPAMALGVPVIFVEQGNGFLPGGRQRTGRVEGLLDFFIASIEIWARIGRLAMLVLMFVPYLW